MCIRDRSDSGDGGSGRGVRCSSADGDSSERPDDRPDGSCELGSGAVGASPSSIVAVRSERELRHLRRVLELDDCEDGNVTGDETDAVFRSRSRMRVVSWRRGGDGIIPHSAGVVDGAAGEERTVAVWEGLWGVERAGR